tara:strand:+ start:91 stop:801 length:711 start_codon:yes stop_codon:yes gene_type:complete
MKRKIHFLFDVDGTLTPSRLPIDPKFESFFLKWIRDKSVYLITGSDKEKTIEQIGLEIWTNVTRAYQSCGNQVWEKGNLILEKPFYLSEKLNSFFQNILSQTIWNNKFGNHIEERVGLINFSTIGRNCPQDEREKYYQWDNKVKERQDICKKLMEEFPELEASVGGQISIDIHPKGANKSQILNDISGTIYFFGDKTEKGGNDYPIVERLNNEKREFEIFSVSNPEKTLEILQNLN